MTFFFPVAGFTRDFPGPAVGSSWLRRKGSINPGGCAGLFPFFLFLTIPRDVLIKILSRERINFFIDTEGMTPVIPTMRV